MSSLGIQSHTKTWDAHVRNHQFGENNAIDTAQSERLQKQGNARINNVSAMRQGLAMIIEKVGISRNVECLETDLHRAGTACCID